MNIWKKCLDHLEGELPAQQFNTWIRPLQAIEGNGSLRILAPNRYVLDWVKDHFFDHISSTVHGLSLDQVPRLQLEIGSQHLATNRADPVIGVVRSNREEPSSRSISSNLNSNFTFESFVEGKSNQLARAASMQIGENPGGAYNPLFIYGGVGLGKTHLMHAIGNLILERNPAARVVYLHSERFVADMVKALQHNAINNFKKHYRSLNALLIDDIQFFAGKERSQEEFFHTFNSLMENQQQVVLTCD